MVSAVAGLRGTVFSDVCDSVGDCGAKRFGDWLGEVEPAAHVSCSIKTIFVQDLPCLNRLRELS